MATRAGRMAFAGAGLAFVGIGAVGIVVPVVPTTPFLLLAAACFLRSSPRLHRWLHEHPRLGPYVRGFAEGGAIPLAAKRRSIAALWLALVVSGGIVLATRGGSPATAAVLFALLVVGLLVTRYIAGRPTAV